MQPTLLFDYPRFMGNPIQNFVANNKEEMFEYITTYANFKNLYISVYKFFDITNKYSVLLDKALFDFDKDKENPDSLKYRDDTIKLHEDLLKDKILHLINLTGGGFHVIPFLETKESYLNKADTLFNMQHYYQTKLNIYPDQHIKGDLKRIFRIPNTFNYNKQRFCVNINPSVEHLLYGSMESLYEYASKPHKIEFFGSQLMDINQFDNKRTYSSCDVNFNFDSQLDGNYEGALKEIYDKAPDCIKYIIDKKHLNNKERYFLILYLKETLYNKRLLGYEDIIGLMHEILDEEKWDHFVNGENLKPLNSIMEKNYYIPVCTKIKYEYKCCPHVEKGCGLRHPRYN